MCGRTGDSIHVRELAASLSKVGNSVTLVGHTPEDSLDQVPSLFKGLDVSVHIPQKRSDVAILRFCSRLVKEHKPEVIYERRYSPKLGAGLSMLHKLPLVVEINGLVEEEMEILGRAQDARKVSGKARKSLRKRFFTRASKVVAVTEGIRKGIHRLYGIPVSRMTVVHNGANTDLFRPMSKDSCRKELGLDPNRTYLCFVGNLVPWQGVDRVIRAVPKVGETIPQVSLLIVGEGDQREELERLAQDLRLSDSVHFVGNVPYEEVPLYINASDICLAPKIALSSGYSPLKLYEYMACARPVVASRVPGFEILEEGAGLLFDPGDVEDLSSKIVALIPDREKMDSMGAKGREIVEREYSWMAVAERIFGVLEEVVS
jgi:glycosyltransferase involved in cell wall biosynthesis